MNSIIYWDFAPSMLRSLHRKDGSLQLQGWYIAHGDFPNGGEWRDITQNEAKWCICKNVWIEDEE